MRWRLIGSGLKAKVYGKEGFPWALKIGPIEDSWLKYADWALQNPNEYAPKIRRVRYVNVPNQKSKNYVALVERCSVLLRRHDDCSLVAWWYDNIGTKMQNFTENNVIDEKFSGLHSFLNSLRQIATRDRLEFDLHDENVMFRKDGSLCIIDPFF